MAGDVDSLLEQATMLIGVRRYDQALALLARAAAQEPGNAVIHARVALALVNAGRAEEAAEAAGRAIALRPDWASPHLLLSLALSRQAEILRRGRARQAAQAAVAAAREAVRLDPAEASAHAALAEAQILARDDRGAEASARLAVTLEPWDEDTWVSLGFVLLRQRKWAEAEAACRRALAIDPNDAGALNNLGAALDAMGRPKEAARSFADAARLRPDDPTPGENVIRTGLDRIKWVMLVPFMPLVATGAGILLYFLIAALVRGYLARDIDRLPLFLRRAARRWGMHLARRRRTDPRRVFLVALGIWVVVLALTGDAPQGLRNFLFSVPILVGAALLPRLVRDARWARRRRRARGS